MKNLENVDRPCPPNCEHCNVEMKDSVAEECDHDKEHLRIIDSNVNPESHQMFYPRGHPGLGYMISEFGGDGECEVYIRRDEDGAVTEVMIRTPIGAPDRTVKKSQFKKVGVVGIDSGRFMIIDPCYLFK
jgi:hypothetical protein